MALLKCKMCGGSLEVTAGETIIECEYCGTQQTLPKTTDENVQALFNRANLLRQKSEFDKAEAIYEKILEVDDTEAEAYWGVILCKFGIEYVEDPKTFKRIPTCHRTSYDSITADPYYKKAIKCADAGGRSIYEAEAKKIAKIQKEILAISSQEEPYDVFICYKEKDDNGQRTLDSVIANDIYYQLTQEGFKVFYAAITLEDKLGSAYEPIIFAALNSSKVMLTIGTKPEYFNAVWVKNEWSRFLKMMKTDRSKMLIPCYKGMDAYELPEEFAHLQAQDMGKIGFINDIVRGIKKVIVSDEPKATVVVETAETPTNANIAPLLKRAFIFLEDGDWGSADEYCEKVLDQDPENAQAYLGKLMAELQVKKQEQLKDYKTTFESNSNYNKVLRYDNELGEVLKGYNEAINHRNQRQKFESTYSKARAMMELGTDSAYRDASDLFDSIIEYNDARELKEHCLEKAEECRKNDIYANAINHMNRIYNPSFEKAKAIELFKSIPGWRDADKQIAICESELREFKRRVELARIAQEKQKKKKIRIAIISVAALVAIIVLVSIVSGVRKNNFLKQAREYYLAGDAAKASDFLLDHSIDNDTQKAYECVSKGEYYDAVQTYGLKDIVIPNSVTAIGYSAFYKCTSLQSVTILDSVTSIGGLAFGDCKSLTSITIPDSVFSNCTSLTSITIPNSVTRITRYAFNNCTSLTSITIPDSVTSIGDSAFYNCTSLTSIKIPDSVTSIGEWAFYGCTSLTSIVIPNSVTSIGERAFRDCTSLTSIVIPDSVTSIGICAFYNCTALKKVVIPYSVKVIGDSAFRGCTSLTIYCEASSKPSGWNRYWNYSNRPVVWNYKGN